MTTNDSESVIEFDEKWIKKHRTIMMLSDSSHTDCDYQSDQMHKGKWKENT